MCTRTSLLVAAVAICFSMAGCLMGSEADVAPPRSSATPPGAATAADDLPPATESTRSDLSAARALAGQPPHNAHPIPAVLSADLVDLMIGDFSCLGDNLPAPPSDAERTISGRTVFFGTPVAAPGITVEALTAEGEALAEVVSDDGGRFELTVPDTDEASVGTLVTSGPGFEVVRYATTHRSGWLDGDVVLGALKPADVALVEAAAAVSVDATRGSLIARLYDCSGDSQVSGARLAIEGVPDPEIFYATSRLGLSNDLDRTTSTSQVYVFNLEPGTYSLAAWGFVAPGPDGAVLINRAVVAVSAGQLSVVDILPE